MLPKILQQLNTPLTNNIRQIAGLMKGDPRAIMRQMSNTPQMQEAQRLISNAGGNAQKAFYELARQKGVDPNEILTMLK